MAMQFANEVCLNLEHAQTKLDVALGNDSSLLIKSTELLEALREPPRPYPLMCRGLRKSSGSKESHQP